MGDFNTFNCSFVSIQYIVCECGETFPSEKDLRDHLVTDGNHCQKNSNKNNIETSNDDILQQQFKCASCNNIYLIEEEFLQHKCTSHYDIASDLIAELSDNQGITDKSYNIRVESKEVKVKAERKVEKTIQAKPTTNVVKRSEYICETCGKTYGSNAALNYHQRVHTGERPYQCPFCPKKFTMPLFLQIHQRIHTGEKPYSCPLCPKAFTNRAALLRHERVHTGEKPYQCTKCSKSFSQSNSMKLHVLTVHMKMPAPYTSKRRREKQLSKKNALSTTNVIKNEEEIALQLDDIKQEQFYYTEYQEGDETDIAYEIIYENFEHAVLDE